MENFDDDPSEDLISPPVFLSTCVAQKIVHLSSPPLYTNSAN
jgi:hypothetical protein